MKYLKRFNEELTGDKIRDVVSKSGEGKDAQKKRLLSQADKLDKKAMDDEYLKSAKEKEEERMKDPNYAYKKKTIMDQKNLSSAFKQENLNFYFAAKDAKETLCFKYQCQMVFVGPQTNNKDYEIEIYGMDGFDSDIDEQYITFLSTYDEGDTFEIKNWQGKGETNFESRDLNEVIPILITKDGIKFLDEGVQFMKKIQCTNIDTEINYKGISLVGMDSQSKNKLANFIKSYDKRATTGNNKLKVNGVEMPVFGKDFSMDEDGKLISGKPLDLKNVEMEKFGPPTLPTESDKKEEPVKSDKKEEPVKSDKKEEPSVGGRIKNFLGFGKK